MRTGRAKRLTAALAAAVLAAAAAVSAAFAEGMGGGSGDYVFPAKTPYDTKYTEICWSTEAQDAVGVPKVYGEHLLLPVGERVVKLDERRGTLSGETALPAKVLRDARGAVCGDKLLQPTEAGVCVIDIVSSELLGNVPAEGIVTDIAAFGDSACFCVKGEGYEMCLMSISALAEEAERVTLPASPTSPTVYGGGFVLGAGSSLVCVRDGKAAQSDIGAEITAVYAGEYALFLSLGDGRLCKLRLNDDGTVEDGSQTFAEAGEELSLAVEWGGSLYATSKAGLHIIDSLNMGEKARAEELPRGSVPVVTYGNGPRVYTVVPGERYETLYCVVWSDDMAAPTATRLASVDDFKGGVITVSEGGTMYLRDGIGRVFALREAEHNVLIMVVKLVMLLALIVFVIIIFRYWAKHRNRGSFLNSMD